MKTTNKKTESRTRRRQRIRAKISGTAARPRLAVFRSNRYIYAQLIDDESGKTLAAVSSRDLKTGKENSDFPKAVGREIAKKGAEKKIKAVVFDRSGYVYTGKIKALADGAREGGLKF